MNKKTRLSLALTATIILVLAGGWYWYTEVRPGASSLMPTSDFPYEKTQDGSRTYVEDTALYHLEATYPDSAGIEASAGKGNDHIAVESMELFVRQTLSDFATQETLPGEYARSLSLGYTQHSAPKASSFVFTILFDTGGAHPITYFKTFVWGKGGGQVSLDDLLSGGYLARLSTISGTQIRARLEAQSDGEGGAVFEEGFAPDAKNFENFYLDGGDLVILFDPYQVAAYAAGPQEVRIPLSQISDIVRPEFK